MTFVQIPAGEFMMGSPASEPGHQDDERRHRVRLTRPFLCRHPEVTERSGTRSSARAPPPSSRIAPSSTSRGSTCRRSSTRLNRLGHGRFRLPTEAEWEYACRAGTTTAYHGGDTLTTDQANYNGGSRCRARRPGQASRRRSTDAGSFPPNAWGLHDMHGNAWEWTADAFCRLPRRCRRPDGRVRRAAQVDPRRQLALQRRQRPLRAPLHPSSRGPRRQPRASGWCARSTDASTEASRRLRVADVTTELRARCPRPSRDCSPDAFMRMRCRVQRCVSAPCPAQAPVSYRLSFPAPEHRWMQVEVTFSDVPSGPLQVRMSRTSPGRYALHEFSKNVFDVRVRDGKGTALTPARPDLHQWDVAGHDGTVVVTLSHLRRSHRRHLSERRRDARAPQHAGDADVGARLRGAAGARPLRAAGGPEWRVATQLYPTDDPLTFTAPNFHYLMDSPTEFSALHAAHVPRPEHAAQADQDRAPTFRIALHHDGTDADADAFARDTETHRPRDAGDLRRVPAVREQHLHVSRGLPAVGQRRRHGASQQHRAVERRRAAQSAAADRAARDRRARVLPLVEHGAHPREGSRAVQLRGGRRVGRAVARRRLHELLRRSDHAPRRT